MSRLALFILFAVWAVGSDTANGRLPTGAETVQFLGGFAVIVTFLAGWGWKARNGRTGRFLRAVWLSRQLAVAWFAYGIFRLHWIELVDHWIGPTFTGPLAKYPLESLPALIGTSPALLAWIGITACRYPDRSSAARGDGAVRSR